MHSQLNSARYKLVIQNAYAFRAICINHKRTLSRSASPTDSTARGPSMRSQSDLEDFIQDWHWDERSHQFARKSGAFLLAFIEHLEESGLSAPSLRAHSRNTWFIGKLTSDYGYHKSFRPGIFLHGRQYVYEFRRKARDSAHAVSSYVSTWRKLGRYVRALAEDKSD
jgi:hypothetical protein